MSAPRTAVRRGRGIAPATLGVGAALLLAAARLPPGQGPPIYDGLCIVSPYQYLAPPPGSSAHATSAAKSLDVSAGQPGTELITGETPPQATLDLGEGTLAVPPGVARVKLSITPVAPPAAPPDDGVIDGNVYRFQATTDAGAPVPIAPGRTAEVLLRPTSPGAGELVIEHLVGGRWKRLDTSLMTCAATQAAVTPSLGDLAVVRPGGGGPAASGDEGGGAPVGLLAVAGVVVVLGTLMGLIRLKRSRSGPAGGDGRRRGVR